MHDGYLKLKLSWELFQKAPEALDDAQQARLESVADRQSAIEGRILASPECAAVCIPETTLATRLAEIRARYASADEYQQDMARIGLCDASLASAVERDLRMEAVLDSVAAAVSPVDEVEAEIYYRLHPDAFDRPEARRLRHILITWDNDAEQRQAITLLESLRTTAADVDRFADAALRHSQCPTAMDGGQLGTVKRGQLFAELEPPAFALTIGEVSAVLQSPIGLHILRCDDILPSGPMPFAEAQQKIVEHLTDRRRREAQQAWVRTLTRGTAARRQ